MTMQLSPQDMAKKAAAERAALLVETGMKIGLGTGTTAAFLVEELALRARTENLDITCVSTSTATEKLATDLGLRVTSLAQARWLDLTIDGADEFDGEFNLIKGGGGALLQEKIVATASDRMVVIADASKQVTRLGTFPLPVEVLGFGMEITRLLLEEMLESLDVTGHKAVPRMRNGVLVTTDEGNQILDLHLGRIGNARQLALILNQVPGVVENGLFIDICDSVVLGHTDGTSDVLDLNYGEQHPENKNVFADMTI